MSAEFYTSDHGRVPQIESPLSIPSPAKLTTVEGDLIIEPESGLTKFGESWTSSHSLTSGVGFGCPIEVDGSAFFDSSVNVIGTLIANSGCIVAGGLLSISYGSRFWDDTKCYFGTSSNSGFVYSTNQTNNALLGLLPASSKSIIFCEKADVNNDWLRPVEDDPTIYLESSDDTDTTKYLRLTWDEITTGNSNLILSPATNKFLVLDSFKATTGDPASPVDGMLVINTADQNVQIYADGAWRTLASW